MKNVSKDTIIRTIVTFVALVNSVLTMIGKNPLPFSDDEVYLFFSTLLTVFSTVWSWWKNNSFTWDYKQGRKNGFFRSAGI